MMNSMSSQVGSLYQSSLLNSMAGTGGGGVMGSDPLAQAAFGGNAGATAKNPVQGMQAMQGMGQFISQMELAAGMPPGSSYQNGGGPMGQAAAGGANPLATGAVPGASPLAAGGVPTSSPLTAGGLGGGLQAANPTEAAGALLSAIASILGSLGGGGEAAATPLATDTDAATQGADADLFDTAGQGDAGSPAAADGATGPIAAQDGGAASSPLAAIGQLLGVIASLFGGGAQPAPATGLGATGASPLAAGANPLAAGANPLAAQSLQANPLAAGGAPGAAGQQVNMNAVDQLLNQTVGSIGSSLSLARL